MVKIFCILFALGLSTVNAAEPTLDGHYIGKTTTKNTPYSITLDLATSLVAVQESNEIQQRVFGWLTLKNLSGQQNIPLTFFSPDVFVDTVASQVVIEFATLEEIAQPTVVVRCRIMSERTLNCAWESLLNKRKFRFQLAPQQFQNTSARKS